MLVLHARQVTRQRRAQHLGQHGDPVPAAFAVTNADLGAMEVDVLDPQVAAFEEAKAAAVEERRHQPTWPIEMPDYRGHFRRCEYDR